MFLSGGIPIPLTESEVEKKNDVCILPQPYSEVIRFDVTMNEIFLMHILDSKNHFSSKHTDRFQRKLAITVTKEIFEAGTQ